MCSSVFINKQENKTEKYLHRAYHHLPANYTFKIVCVRVCVCIEWWGKVQQRHTLIKPFELNKERHQYSQHCLLCDHCSQRIQTSVSIVSWSASCCPITNAAITPVIWATEPWTKINKYVKNALQKKKKVWISHLKRFFPISTCRTLPADPGSLRSYELCDTWSFWSCN